MKDERKKLIDGIFEECKKMVIEQSYPISEDELVETAGMGSFEFGYACGVLALADKIIRACMNGWRVRTKYNNVLSVIKKYM